MCEDLKRTSVKARFFRRISKSLSDYCIYLCSTADFKNLPPAVRKNGARTYITVTGTNLPAAESVEVEYFGEWVSNRKYGIQFKADSYQFVQPSSEKGIKAFLKSKAFPGIGAKTADAIVAEFGKESLDVIRSCPSRLLAVPGLSPSKVGAIISAFKKNEAYSEITVFLSQYGLSSDSIVRINEKYGENAVDTIRKNPYEIQELKGIGFKTCDRIARGLQVSLDSYERVRGGILEAIKAHVMKSGDTCIKAETLENDAMTILNDGIIPPPVSQELFRTVARSLSDCGEIVFRNKSLCFLKEYDEAEDYTAKALLFLQEKAPDASPISVLDEVERYKVSSKISLTDNQTDAVRMVLSNRVSVITGGPGTGKTTILTAILDYYKGLYNKEVILLAPTGKAARRMTESTGQEAFTIHSRLGIFNSEGHGEPASLPEGLIVVDESSMVDAMLMAKLMHALSPKSHIVFIGDIDQLPSVSAGNVLSNIISSGMIPVARLTEIFRQAEGSTIIENAGKINRGRTDLVYDECFSLVEANGESDALEKVKKVYEEETSKYGIDNVALLCPLRRSQNGRFRVVADELNDVLQDIVTPRTSGKYCSINSREYRTGDRVLQWKNTDKSSNGDIGEIKEIGEKDGDIAVKVKWDNGNTTIENRQSMADITLAYAISVHKSQGSQYSSVIIPLLSEQICQLMSRPLLYTATTRSRERVTYIGSRKAIDYCISHMDENGKRVTLLSQRLKYYSGI